MSGFYDNGSCFQIILSRFLGIAWKSLGGKTNCCISTKWKLCGERFKITEDVEFDLNKKNQSLFCIHWWNGKFFVYLPKEYFLLNINSQGDVSVRSLVTINKSNLCKKNYIYLIKHGNVFGKKIAAYFRMW